MVKVDLIGLSYKVRSGPNVRITMGVSVKVYIFLCSVYKYNMCCFACFDLD